MELGIYGVHPPLMIDNALLRIGLEVPSKG